jgi:hypothetical protein
MEQFEILLPAIIQRPESYQLVPELIKRHLLIEGDACCNIHFEIFDLNYCQ